MEQQKNSSQELEGYSQIICGSDTTQQMRTISNCSCEKQKPLCPGASKVSSAFPFEDSNVILITQFLFQGSSTHLGIQLPF